MNTLEVFVMIISMAGVSFVIGELISRYVIKQLRKKARVRRMDLEVSHSVEFRAEGIKQRAISVQQRMRTLENDLLPRG